MRRLSIINKQDVTPESLHKYAPDVVFREIGNLFIVSFNRPCFLEQEGEGEAATHETTPKTTQEKIMAGLRAEPTLTRKLMAQRLGISKAGVKYHLNKLKAAGRIRHVGPTKGGRWAVVEHRPGESMDEDNG